MIRDEEAFERVALAARDKVLAVLMAELQAQTDNQMSVAIAFGAMLAAARMVVAAKAADIPVDMVADAYVAIARDAANVVSSEARNIDTDPVVGHA